MNAEVNGKTGASHRVSVAFCVSFVGYLSVRFILEMSRKVSCVIDREVLQVFSRTEMRY